MWTCSVRTFDPLRFVMVHHFLTSTEKEGPLRTYPPRNTTRLSGMPCRIVGLFMGFLCLCVSLPSAAQQPASPPPSPDITACVKACSAKFMVEACVSLDDMKECFNGSIAECQGISSETRGIAGNACAICANLPPACAPTPVAKPAETGKPKVAAVRARPLTEEELCRRRPNATYVEEPVLTESGEPTGEVKKHCFTLRKAHEWLLDLERSMRQLRAKTSNRLSPEELERLRNLINAKDLPPELGQRIEGLKTEGLDSICPPIKGQPNATMRARCTEVFTRLEVVEQRVSFAQQTADAANANADQAHERINGIVDGSTPIPGPGENTRPKLRFSVVGSLHTSRTVNQDFLWLGGAEVEWMPPLTRGLSMAFLGGLGAGSHHDMSDTLVAWAGAGLSGPMFFSDEVIADGLFYYEHWSDRSSSALNFYGAALGLTWMPGVGNRRMHRAIQTNPVTGQRDERKLEAGSFIVPALGFRGAVGESRMTTANGERTGYLDGVLTAHLGIGF